MVPPRTLEAIHKRVGLDTALFIYDWENHPVFGSAARKVLSAVESGVVQGVASSLILAELMVVPIRAGREDLALRYRDHLANFPNLTIVAPGSEICFLAARIRATVPRTRLADATHIATAIQASATAFVTNDFALTSDVGLEIVRLSDLA